MGPCSCGLYHYHQPNSCSNTFGMPYDYDQEMSTYGSSPSSVDCTLSLGTPSTRLTNDKERRHTSNWWNILQPSSQSAALSPHKANRGGGNGSTTSDSLFSRRCANCDTTSTPLWRNGPRGPKSLCNACGIRFKEERRANATASVVVTADGSDATDGYHHQYMMNGNQWVNDYSQSAHNMSSCYSPAASNDFRFMDDVDNRDSTFLIWQLNVTDRPGLVPDSTR